MTCFAKFMMRDGSNKDGNKSEIDAFRLSYDEIDPGGTTGGLRVVVPYTTPELTRNALGHAAASDDLDIHVYLVDLQVIPFHADEPPVDEEFSERRLDDLLKESGVPGKSVVLYTADWFRGFTKILQPESLVILATKRTWWPTREKKLARMLIRAGHQVVLLCGS